MKQARKMFLVLVLAVAGYSASFADESSSYTVIKGDTLASIAGKVYNNPKQWKKIWEANKELIKNPNVVSAGQKLSIPPLDTAAVAPAPAAVQEAQKEEKAAEVSAPEEPLNSSTQKEEMQSTQNSADEEQPAVVKEEPKEEVPPAKEQEEAVSSETAAEDTYAEPAQEKVAPVEAPAASKVLPKEIYSAESFVSPDDWNGDGYITGEKDKRLLISTGDTVYINIGKTHVQPGTKCMVYRTVGKIKDPKSLESLGNEVRRIARIVVSDSVSDSAATAKVTVAFEPLEIGDIVVIIK